jgi:hypothetical protein
VAELVDASDLGSDGFNTCGSSTLPSPTRAGVAHLVEHRPSKPKVAGSSPVARSKFFNFLKGGTAYYGCHP